MASQLPLSRLTSTLRFVRAVGAVRKQLADAAGLIGYTLRARPLARDYWTLSSLCGLASLLGRRRRCVSRCVVLSRLSGAGDGALCREPAVECGLEVRIAPGRVHDSFDADV